MLPAAIGKANAPASKTSDSKFDSLRGKMAAYFIAPGNLCLLNELRKFVRTSHGRFVFCWGNGKGIEALAKPIFVRAQPVNVRHASCPLRLYWERKGDRSIGEANLRKGLCPFYGSAPRTLRRKCHLITPLYRCVAVLFAELREERFQYLDLGRERQTGICHVPRQYNGVLPRIYETGGDFKTLFGGLGIRLGHFR